MTKEKQIEEMAKAVEEASCGYGVDGCHRCKFDGTEDFSCAEMRIAEALYNAGYRKASEVAEEIFAEIDEVIAQSNEISDIRMRELAPHTYKVMREAGKLYYTAIIRAIAELKKKYKGDGE